jgi:EAL domain-containing protein (putative c-di-GMP-specific phosphodiesterase class I)
VNLSARELACDTLVDDVTAALADTGVPPGCLVLELTEDALLADPERSLERLATLKQLGVRIALDDFGSGTSSLNTLRRFPVDVVKVDSTVVHNLRDPRTRALTAAIVEHGRILGLRTVAEGVENPEHLRDVREIGCARAQGFHLHRPLSARQVEELVRDAQPAVAAA